MIKLKSNLTARKFIGFLLFFGVFLFANILSPLYVYAQSETIEYIDKVTVRFRGEVYVDSNPYDETREWKRGVASCQDIVRDSNDGNSERDVALVIIRELAADDTCPGENDGSTERIENVRMTNTDRRNINAYRINANEIFLPIGIEPKGCESIIADEIGKSTVDSGDRLTGRGRYYERLPEEDRVGEPANEYLLVESAALNNRVRLRTNPTRNSAGVYSNSICGGVDITQTWDNVLTISTRTIPSEYGTNDPNTANGSPPGSGGSEGTGDTEGDECIDNLRDGGGFGWIICPVLEMMNGLANELIEQIDIMLTVNPGDYDQPELKEAWAYFRNIASLALIIIGLIMIIGQATSKR